MKPLCPLVHKRHRLEVSIVETLREGGRVKHSTLPALAVSRAKIYGRAKPSGSNARPDLRAYQIGSVLISIGCAKPSLRAFRQ